MFRWQRYILWVHKSQCDVSIKEMCKGIKDENEITATHLGTMTYRVESHGQN